MTNYKYTGQIKNLKVPAKIKGINSDLLAVAFGVLIVIFFLWSNIFKGSVNYNPFVGTDDMMDMNIPYRKFYNETILKRKIPLWSSQISSGYPIMASSEIGSLNPLSLLTVKFNPASSYTASLLIIYSMIFIFTYFYLRQLNLSTYVSIFGSIVAAFSGYSANQIMHLGWLNAYAYFLAEMFIIEKQVRSGKIVYFLLAGLLLGLSILSGHPQIVIYSLLFIYPYWLIRKMYYLSGIKQQVGEIKIFVVGIALFSLIGLGIGAGQLIPQYEFTKNSTRAEGLSSQSAGRYSLSFSDIKAFVSPFVNYSNERSLYGFATNGWPKDEMYIFVGIIPVLLAFLSLFLIKRNRFVLIFTVVLVLSFLFSMGNKSLFAGLLGIPPFSFFRLPFRISFLMNISWAVLSSIALEKITDKKFLYTMTLETSDKNYRKVKIIIIGCLCFFSFINLKDNIKKLYRDVNASDWYKTPIVVPFLKENLRDNERVTAELYYYASIPYFINSAIWNDPETHRNLRNLLPPFSTLLYDIPQNVGAANSGGLKIGRYNDLEEELQYNAWKVDESGNFSVTDSFLFLNRIMGVKYILSNKEFSSFVTSLAKKIEMPQGEAPVYVYEFFDYFPRQFMVPHAQKEEPEKIKEHLFKADFEPKDHIYIEKDSDWGAEGGFSANSKFEKYTDTEVKIKTQASGDGYLFLSDTYYPGWKAWVDGEETEIYRANYAFRAVKVSDGEHEIIFKYEPESVKWGVRITIATFVICVLSIATVVGFTNKNKFRIVNFRMAA